MIIQIIHIYGQCHSISYSSLSYHMSNFPEVTTKIVFPLLHFCKSTAFPPPLNRSADRKCYYLHRINFISEYTARSKQVDFPSPFHITTPKIKIGRFLKGHKACASAFLRKTGGVFLFFFF